MYEIPKQLKRYQARFVFGTFKQDAIGMLVILIALVLLKKLPFHLYANIAIAAIAVLAGAIFLFMNLDEKISTRLQFAQRLAKTSFYKKSMPLFVDVSRIKNNVVYLKNGMILSVVKITPIDFSILSEDQQQDLISRYGIYLNTLQHANQITSRSVNINLENWLQNVENNITMEKNPDKIRLNRFKPFRSWITNQIEQSQIRNRFFYIVVPHSTVPIGLTALRGVFYEILGMKPKEIVLTGEKLEKNLVELRDKADDILEKLNNIGYGFKADMLNDSELVALYSSYYNDIEDVDIRYVTPVMWLEREQNA